MNRGFSIYLDAMRFAAALLVVLSHLAYPRFTGDALHALREWDYGRDAVILFFVLSGLVIAYVAARDGSWQRYMFHRLTRLYSVMVPALLITLLLDRSGAALFPSAYDGWWYSPLPVWEFLIRGLTFTNEWLLGPVRLGSNGPLWSLSYEAAYYLMFGVAFYLKGYRRILLLLLTGLLVGPRVLLLLPVWLFGVWVWHAVSRASQETGKVAAGLMAAMLPIFYVGASAVGLPAFLSSTGGQVMTQLMPGLTQSFSSAFLWNIVLGAFCALHLVGMAKLFENWQFPSLAGKAIRWLSGASFTLYVLHYPLLQFVHAALPASLNDKPLLLLGTVLLACFFVAEFTERRLKVFRGLFPITKLNFVGKT